MQDDKALESGDGPATQEGPDVPGAAPGKTLPDAAVRALREADARRQENKSTLDANEVNGPKGPEPTRYGDWERDGRAVDF